MDPSGVTNLPAAGQPWNGMSRRWFLRVTTNARGSNCPCRFRLDLPLCESHVTSDSRGSTCSVKGRRSRKVAIDAATTGNKCKLLQPPARSEWIRMCSTLNLFRVAEAGNVVESIRVGVISSDESNRNLQVIRLLQESSDRANENIFRYTRESDHSGPSEQNICIQVVSTAHESRPS